MNEDIEFNAFLKSRLEEGTGMAPSSLAEIERAAVREAAARSAERRVRVRRWGGAFLLAASLAAAAGFFVMQAATAPTPEETVADAIELLSVTDETELEETDSVAEMLLAWQDAPYENAVSDLSIY